MSIFRFCVTSITFVASSVVYGTEGVTAFNSTTCTIQVAASNLKSVLEQDVTELGNLRITRGLFFENNIPFLYFSFEKEKSVFVGSSDFDLTKCEPGLRRRYAITVDENGNF